MNLEDRIRQAASSILGDESLSTDLQDNEAQTLLDWGLKLSERVARSADALGEGQASAVLDEGLEAVRRTMRRVSKLIGELGQTDPQLAEERIAKVLEAADRLPGVQVNVPDDLQAELTAMRGMSRAEALERILTWFHVGGE